MDIYLNSTSVLLIAIFALISLVAIFYTKRFINHLRQKNIEKMAREWDAKVLEEWNKIHKKSGGTQTEANKTTVEKVETEEKKESETLIKLEANCPDFFKSPENKFIEQFAEKFANEINAEKLSKLQLLLKNRQWNFSLYELELLVNREVRKQNLESVKFKILSADSKGRDEIIEAYLENYHPSDEKMLTSLREILKERGLFDGNLTELKTELIKINEKIEAEKFANLLLNSNK
jgi:hypothetical protein